MSVCLLRCRAVGSRCDVMWCAELEVRGRAYCTNVLRAGCLAHRQSSAGVRNCPESEERETETERVRVCEGECVCVREREA